MNSTITLTFGDVGENHKGMQQLGQIVDKGQGFNLADLKAMKKQFKTLGCTTKLYHLNKVLDKIPDVDDLVDDAHVLVIKKGVNKLLEKYSKYNYDQLFEEQKGLNYDTKAFMYGRVVNKNARYNLCFDDVAQEPDYEAGKGKIIAYSSMPKLNSLISKFQEYFGNKFVNPHKMKCESNYYYDITQTGISFHGDAERRKVVGVRLGASLPLHYQWFQDSKPIGDRVIIPLDGGDIYVMSEKAVGTDWKLRKTPTLRHATGCSKFTTIA